MQPLGTPLASNVATTLISAIFKIRPSRVLGTKETAFVHASTTAAVDHAVTAACSTGNLTDCACDAQGGSAGGEGTRGLPPSAPGSPALIADSWQWGGCSDNVNYGVWFAETFVDATDEAVRAASSVGEKSYIRALVNLHNNEVGRKVGRQRCSIL